MSDVNYNDFTILPLTTASDPDQVYNNGLNSSYTDDLNYILTNNNATSIRMCTRALSPNGSNRYVGGVLQTIASTALLASSTTSSTGVVGGFAFAYVFGAATFGMYRIAVTGDIATAGNWTTLTLSGADFGISVRFAGYENGNFWFSNGSSKFFKATLSGTTMTENTSVTVTGSSYLTISRVNNNGIYASFTASPNIRKADLTGVLQADQTVQTATTALCTATSFYVNDGTSNPLFKLPY